MNATLADFATLVLRLWVGLHLCLAHGLPKAADPQAFLSSVEPHFPLPTVAGWFAILAELVGGACLALGLRTRLAAAAILPVMLGAALVFHAGDPWVVRKELPLTYAVVALFFLVHAGGPLSLDARLQRRRRSRSPW
jgi:putative oxidoreductase